MQENFEVLVLDDEIIVGERIQNYFERRGIPVEIFTESQKAIDRLKEKTFEVIISDIWMQGPSGIDVLTAVKKEGYKSEVILITGYSMLETYRQAEYIGAYDFIAKPFQMTEIYNLVKKAAKKVLSNK
ncbi:MAG: response regulator [Ignavibacteriaceae bacterium]|nr:response regulator [Ignavibacteriaceae bacterium]